MKTFALCPSSEQNDHLILGEGRRQNIRLQSFLQISMLASSDEFVPKFLYFSYEKQGIKRIMVFLNIVLANLQVMKIVPKKQKFQNGLKQELKLQNIELKYKIIILQILIEIHHQDLDIIQIKKIIIWMIGLYSI